MSVSAVCFAAHCYKQDEPFISHIAVQHLLGNCAFRDGDGWIYQRKCSATWMGFFLVFTRMLCTCTETQIYVFLFLNVSCFSVGTLRWSNPNGFLPGGKHLFVMKRTKMYSIKPQSIQHIPCLSPAWIICFPVRVQTSWSPSLLWLWGTCAFWCFRYLHGSHTVLQVRIVFPLS